MNLWLWIGIPMLFLLGVIVNAIKDMKRLEKQVPQFLDRVRPVNDDEDDEGPHHDPKSSKNTNDPTPPTAP